MKNALPTQLRIMMLNELFHDFEDNLQDCCAEGVQADYIVTANVKDYEKVSIVPAVTPAQLLELFK